MHMRAIRTRLSRLREERGFTMMIALFVMVVTSLLLGATYVALVNDTQLSRTNLDQQRALSAAQAGIAAYTYQLNANPNYWEGCVAPSNQPVPGSTDSGSTEYYNDTPLVASTAPTGTTSCSLTNAVGTMIENSSNASDGTFRVSATGWSGPTSDSTVTSCTPSTNCVERTLVAQYRRESFLNFVYYTDYETLDPSVLYNPDNNPTEPTDCEQHYPNRGNDCGGPINFFSGDVINGPMHSEDTLAICGTSTAGPTFGRTSADTIQAAGLSTEGQDDCNLNYNMIGTYTTTAPSLTPPPSNSQLLDDAENGGYVCTGKTTIVLGGTTMSITNSDSQNSQTTCPTGSSESYPSNGVIYDQTDSTGCSVIYTPFTADSAYTTDSACGNVYVSGEYSNSLTIAAGNDIIVNGNIYPNTVSLTGSPSTPPTPTGSALLGLVANDFVRVYHPVNNRSGTTSENCGNNASNGTGSLTDLYIYAAILAVSHSFIVDNYDCGSGLGTLHIYGALAQLFRGTVATGSSSSISTGYAKDYVYDDRLSSLEPPYFLNPVDSAWYVQRQTECDSASTC